MFTNKNIRALRSNLLFNGIKDSIITRSYNSKNIRREKEGSLIYRSGDKIINLYLIIKGEVKIKYSSSNSGPPVIKSANEFFGEADLIAGTARNSSAVANTDCVLYMIDKDDLHELVLKNEKIYNNLKGEAFEESAFEDQQDSPAQPLENNPGFDSYAENIIETGSEKNYDENYFDKEPAIIHEDDKINNDNVTDFDEERVFFENINTTDDTEFNLKEISQQNLPDKPETDKPFLFEDSFLDEFDDEDFSFDEFHSTQTEQVKIKYNSEEKPAGDPATNKETVTESGKYKQPAEGIKAQYANDESVIHLIEETNRFLINSLLIPVESIKRNTALLKEQSGSEEILKLTDIVSKDAESIIGIVETSLDFLTDNRKTKLQQLNISEVITEILILLSDYSNTKDVKIYSKIKTDVKVNIDKSRFYNACYQITKNALDAMPEGGNLFIIVSREGNQVKIEFVDEGPGIPSGIKDEIFEPLTTHGKQDGVGLGLSITKEIIEDHGGYIFVKSEPGEGTKIIISLPVLE